MSDLFPVERCYSQLVLWQTVSNSFLLYPYTQITHRVLCSFQSAHVMQCKAEEIVLIFHSCSNVTWRKSKNEEKQNLKDCWTFWEKVRASIKCSTQLRWIVWALSRSQSICKYYPFYYFHWKASKWCALAFLIERCDNSNHFFLEIVCTKITEFIMFTFAVKLYGDNPLWLSWDFIFKHSLSSHKTAICWEQKSKRKFECFSCGH